MFDEKDRRKAMMITTDMLKAVLAAREPWHPRAFYWRKLSNGRIVRFVNWNWRRP